MSTTTFLIIGILFIGLGFIFGFMVGTMVTIETIEQKIKRDKE